MRSSNTGASILRLLVLLALFTVASVPAWAVPQKAVAQKPQANSAAPRSLPALRSRADFDRMARVYTDQPYALPHVIFVIDRRDHDKIYYVNSQRFRFHRDFVKGTYLSLENAEDFFRNNYLK